MMSTLMLAGALAGALQAAPVSAPADDGTLAALVEEALARNPDLRAAEEALRAARERPGQASALADPALGVTYTNDGWSPSLGGMPDTTLAVMLSQDLPYPGKRRLRGEISALAADEVAQQVERMRMGVAASVRRAYYGLLQARAVAGLTVEQADVWRQIEGVARARYSVGQGNQQDVLRTQVELTRVGQVMAEQESETAIRLAEINRLLDRPADTTVPAPGTLDEVGEPDGLALELERLRATSPEVAAARVALDRARLAVDLAKRDYRPDFAVSGGYMNRGGLDPMWQAGVSVTLPFNRKRRAGAVAEAEALLAAARSRAAAVDLQLRLRTQERLAQLDATRKITVLYREGIVPQDRMSVEAAIASYQAGRVPFVTVLEALTTLYGDRVALVRLLAGQSRIRASLDEASLEATSELPAAAIAAVSGAAATNTGGAMGSMSR
jgi:cobalt-zinc-cadmium efflux system outer membrane protein